MNIIQCSICKKPFQSLGRKICNECLEKIDKDFIIVRDYIYEHKHADVDKVSEDTGVSKHTIIYLLKEGRLIVDDPSGSGGGLLTCEVCRRPINSGRMCDGCKEKVSSTMQRSIETGRPMSQQRGAEASLKATAKLQNK